MPNGRSPGRESIHARFSEPCQHCMVEEVNHKVPDSFSSILAFAVGGYITVILEHREPSQSRDALRITCT